MNQTANDGKNEAAATKSVVTETPASPAPPGKPAPTARTAPAIVTPPTKSGPHVKYLVRRETHSSRAITAVVVALAVIAALAYLITEAVLSLLGREPLLMKPHAMVDHVVAMGSDYQRFIPATIIVAGVVIALIGLFLLLKAILPGALRRHAITDGRMAVVVDDAVIAAGVSRSLRRRLRLDSGQVTTSVQRKRLTAHVTPTSGVPVSDSEVSYHVQHLIDGWELQPSPQVEADINTEGVVGR